MNKDEKIYNHHTVNCLQQIAHTLHNGSHQAYLVGGSVRDLLLMQYPLTDRRNEENLTSLPKPPDASDSKSTMPNVSSDFALGEPCTDWDIATNGDVVKIAKQIANTLGGFF